MQVVCEIARLRAVPPYPPRRGRLRRRLATPPSSGLTMANKAPIPSAPGDWERLIEAVALRRDRAAFAALFSHFAPRVKTFMRRSGASDAEAENLAQETMLRVWRKAEKYHQSASGFQAWLFTIARNLRIDALRRERGGMLEGASDIDGEFLLDDAPLADEALASRQSAEQIRSAVAGLSDEQQRVIELSFYQEMAHAEIANVLGIPLGTVKSRLRLAMGKLRSLLSEAL